MFLHQLMENLGTAAFAISGALAALNKRLDVFGVRLAAMQWKWDLPSPK